MDSNFIYFLLYFSDKTLPESKRKKRLFFWEVKSKGYPELEIQANQSQSEALIICVVVITTIFLLQCVNSSTDWSFLITDLL